MSSKRVSHRDPEERDNEEELDHESSTASTAQKLSQGTKAVLDKSWSLIWGNITAPVNDAHTVNEAPDKSLDVHRLGLRMHHSTSGLPATSGKVTFTQDLEQQNQAMAQVLTYLLANRSKKGVDARANAIEQLLDNTLQPPPKRRKT